IDMNGNNILDNSDLVWGTDPLDLLAACIDSMDNWPANQTFDWTSDIAAFVGFSIWQGGTQTFSVESDTGISMGERFHFDTGRYAQ
ncbi:MAG: hypothetical protein IIA40_12475, partial [SAR324 cluster bacterium]|nr:hypothetical protein [SAR324 cluster bacterium]